MPSFLAFSVVGLLEQHFTRYVDYDFTASMEDDLDRIAAGEEARNAWLHRFYFGDGEPGLLDLTQDLGAIDAREVSSFKIPGSDITIRVGRYGPYLERDGQRANIPPDLVPDELTIEKAEELLAQPSGDHELGVDPATGLAIVAKTGRYGPYVTEVLPEDSKDEPRTASLFKSMSVDTVSLEDALQLLTLPRSLGAAADGEEVVAKNGPYGPYVQQEQGDALDRERGAAPHDHVRGGARRACATEAAAPPRPGEAAARGARRRPRRPAKRSSSRRASSARTSPTGRRTRASVAATIRSPSTSTAHSNCSPSGARRVRRRSPRGRRKSS